MKLRKTRFREILFLGLFIVVLIASILFGTVLNMPQISLALLVFDFPIAIVIAVLASLSIREEEEEKILV